MKKIISLLVIVASMTIFNSCVSCGGNDDSLYDEEYWNSVGREKAMRKAGLTSRADIEKDERQSRLKKMKANPSSKSSNVSVNMGQDQGEIIYQTVGGRSIYVYDRPNGNKKLKKCSDEKGGKSYYIISGDDELLVAVWDKRGWAYILPRNKEEDNYGWVKHSLIKGTSKRATSASEINLIKTYKDKIRPIYGIKSKTNLLDKPNGNKILNEEATNYFGNNRYYEIGSLDKIYILEEKGDWVKVQNTQFEISQGWIKKSYLIKTK